MILSSHIYAVLLSLTEDFTCLNSQSLTVPGTNVYVYINYQYVSMFDAVGWAAGRASGP